VIRYPLLTVNSIHKWTCITWISTNPLGTDHLTWRGGVMVFCFDQNFFFRTTRIRIFIFFVAQSAIFFSPEFNIRLYDKNSESDYFFSPPQNQHFFFSNIGNQNIFFRKNHNPPPPFKLNGRSLIMSALYKTITLSLIFIVHR
jgi:hypothetical protein